MSTDREPPLNVRPDRDVREQATALAATRKISMTELINGMLKAFIADPDAMLGTIAPFRSARRRGRPPSKPSAETPSTPPDKPQPAEDLTPDMVRMPNGRLVHRPAFNPKPKTGR